MDTQKEERNIEKQKRVNITIDGAIKDELIRGSFFQEENPTRAFLILSLLTELRPFYGHNCFSRQDGADTNKVAGHFSKGVTAVLTKG